MNAGGVDDWRHYISANGQSVAIVSRRSGVTTTRYLLNDHLGSIAAITDSSGAPILTESFDAFGARRDGEDWDSDCNCSTLSQIASITRHGFTGHEMIGGHSMGLIHMNGRVMDSVTGRFLSPDPFVQFPFDSQSLNRYSYVRNSPMSTTDPSGFQEYDGDVIDRPEPEPSICWMIGGCGGSIWFPRPYVIIVHRPEPKIPPSRATPGPVAGPAVLACANDECESTGAHYFRVALRFAAPTIEENSRRGAEGTPREVATGAAKFAYNTLSDLAHMAPGGKLVQMMQQAAGVERLEYKPGELGTAATLEAVTIVAGGVVGAERAAANIVAKGGSELTRVGRWMSKGEFNQMSETGRVVEGAGGRTSVIRPPNPSSYTAAPPGSVYAEFDVPSGVLRQGGKPDWAIIPGPNITSRIFGPPPAQMPPATCIVCVRGK